MRCDDARMANATAPDGTEIHYEIRGNGEPVILVHGITECGEAWGSITDRLAASRRVIVVDLPGHGQSGDAPSYDVQDLARAVGAVAAVEASDPVRLVGHSLGGVVVSVMPAAGVPVRSIVNVDQPLELAGFQALLQSVEPMLRDPSTFGDFITGLFAQLDGDALPAGDRERLQALRRPRQEVVLGIWGTVLDSPAEALDAIVDEFTSAIGQPYLAIHGGDPGPEYPAWLRAHIPTAVLEVWPGLGHYPHLVQPDRFVERLEEFWALD
jgi:pimeloyl-ACP methyl ester carboxylesterase